MSVRDKKQLIPYTDDMRAEVMRLSKEKGWGDQAVLKRIIELKLEGWEYATYGRIFTIFYNKKVKSVSEIAKQIAAQREQHTQSSPKVNKKKIDQLCQDNAAHSSKKRQKTHLALTDQEQGLMERVVAKLHEKRHVVKIQPDGSIFIFEYPERHQNVVDAVIKGSIALIKEEDSDIYEVDIHNGFFPETAAVSHEFMCLLRENLQDIDERFDIGILLSSSTFEITYPTPHHCRDS